MGDDVFADGAEPENASVVGPKPPQTSAGELNDLVPAEDMICTSPDTQHSVVNKTTNLFQRRHQPKLSLQKAIRKIAKAEKNGDILLALKLCERCIGDFPRNKKILNSQKRLQKAWQSPQQIFPTVLSRSPGKMYDAFKQGRLEDAERLATAHLDHAQHGFDASMIMAAIRKQQGAFNSAVAFLERAVDLRQTDVKILIDLANTYWVSGDACSALKTYETAITRFPKDPIAYFNSAVILRQQGCLQAASAMLRATLMVRPGFVEALAESGLVAADMGQLEFGLAQCRKALEIDPDHNATLTNLAYLSIRADDPGTAISACKRVVAKDPKNADALNTLGMAYSLQRSFVKSIAYFTKTLRVAPNHPFAANNLGNDLLEEGEIDEALSLFRQATARNPTYVTAWVNQHSLELQTLGAVSSIPTDPFLTERLAHAPKHQIHQAIAHFLRGDDRAVLDVLALLRNADQESNWRPLTPQDVLFCKAYAQYLTALTTIERPAISGAEIPLYHVGESHCLSFAGHKLKIDGTDYVVRPRIGFGLKAFHLGADKTAKYRALVGRHLSDIPPGSRVFLSVGEIDCRWNDGIITASEKLNIDLATLTRKTVEHAMEWIAKQNANLHHELYMINVPAPTFFEGVSKDENEKAAFVVRTFNTLLAELAETHGIKVIDVYSQTHGRDGFSNGLYHCDSRHLDSRILPEIESQLNNFGSRSVGFNHSRKLYGPPVSCPN